MSDDKRFEKIFARVNADQARIRENVAAVEKNFADRGYGAGLTASRDIGFGWEDAIDWTVGKLNKQGVLIDPDGSHARIDQLHDLCSEDHGPTAQRRLKRAMSYAIALSSKDVHSAATRMSNGGVPKTPETVFTADEARGGLKAQLTAAGQANADTVWHMAQRAVNNADELAKMGLKLNAMQTAAKRWRGILFLHLISGDLELAVGTTNAKSIGAIWQEAASAARAAHAKYVKEVKREHRKVFDLKARVGEALSELYADKLVIKDRMPKDREEKIADATKSLYGALNKLFTLNAIDKDQADAIRSVLADQGVEEPEAAPSTLAAEPAAQAPQAPTPETAPAQVPATPQVQATGTSPDTGESVEAGEAAKPTKAERRRARARAARNGKAQEIAQGETVSE
jgi:hypothetical protein